MHAGIERADGSISKRRLRRIEIGRAHFNQHISLASRYHVFAPSCRAAAPPDLGISRQSCRAAAALEQRGKIQPSRPIQRTLARGHDADDRQRRSRVFRWSWADLSRRISANPLPDDAEADEYQFHVAIQLLVN